MRPLNRIIGKVLRALFGMGPIVLIKNSLILGKKYGQYRSANEWSCVNAEGLPIPWYTYPTIEYLENINLDGINVFEYGSGNSSFYYLMRGANVTSIEDNAKWYEKIKSKNNNDTFKYVLALSEDDYVKREEIKTADIIVIDGSHRPQCTDHVIQNISKLQSNPNLIIFDNSDWYPKTIKEIDDKIGWVRVDFCGFGPINGYTWVTSIYLNPGKKLSRIDSHIKSISGTGGNAET